MNVKRFTARTSREAMNLVKQAFGDDAVVLSTRPCVEGIEMLAMAADGIQQIERAASAPAATASIPGVRAESALPQSSAKPLAASRRAEPRRIEPALGANDVEQDVQQLSMSTLSFQDYVRERMLKRRRAEMGAGDGTAPADRHGLLQEPDHAAGAMASQQRATTAAASVAAQARAIRRDPPVLREAIGAEQPQQQQPAAMPALADPAPQRWPHEAAAARREQQDMMNELRSMKGLIEERFGALAFMDKLRRSPKQAQLSQRLLDCGFSPALIRKLIEGMTPDVGDESAWAATVLERNLLSGDGAPAVEDQGGVYALIGSTGVGKTTSTAKIAATFATKHGAANLGLITLDAYRVGAHEQLRTYGRILGVPVHTAHDRASLEDLLELLSGKRMVLIDTAGIAQRDTRTRDLLDMLSHRSIRKLVVVNAAAQGETIEDVLISWRAGTCSGAVLSKIDEAVKLGPALDALIRHKLTIVGVANGQRVPEDWHRLSSHALVHRALRGGGSSSWRIEADDVNLVFAGMRGDAAAGATQLAF